MSEVPFGQDGDFSEERFRATVNSALANSVGNLINRCLKLLKKNCDGAFPVGAGDVAEDDAMRFAVAEAVRTAQAAYEKVALHEAVAAALSVVRRYLACCRKPAQ